MCIRDRSQSIAFPSVYINQGKLATSKVKSSEWQLKGSQLEIATQVKQVYWQLAYLYSKQRLLRYQDSLFSGFQRAADLRAKAGETNRLEMITAHTQSMEVKNKLYEVTADIGIYTRKLQTLLNSKHVIVIEDTILTRMNLTPVPDTLPATTNPTLNYIQQQVEVSRNEKKLEQSRMLPDLNIGYFSQTMIGTQEVEGLPKTFGSSNRFNGIQAGIAIPIWFKPNTSRNKAAAVNEQIAITNAEYYSKSLAGNYQNLLDEYSKYSNSVDYYEQQAMPEAELIIEQSGRSYKAGAMDYLDYVLNLDKALSIKQNYLDALSSYNQTIIEIEFLTGKTF
jgi:cobalt-zinc-cadmium resistance protein CzcA